MKPLLINCPNCGAPLRGDGYCEYCDTQIRYANEVELLNLDDIFMPNEVQIMFKVKKKDATLLIPFRGFVESIATSYERETFYADNTPILSAAVPHVQIELDGHIDRSLLENDELEDDE